MALDMTPEQKAVGKENFNRVVGKMADADQQAAQAGMTRRRFMQGLIATGATIPVSAAAYFGYRDHSFPRGMRPIKAGIIGCGDEGGVLVGAHNPNFIDFVGYSDIRPTNRARIFSGQAGTPRIGFNAIRDHLRLQYGQSPSEHIRQYDDYRQLLANNDIEMVVIALPLHLHAKVSIEAMRAGKHVLCEKLMAWNIKQCKEMIRVSDETGKYLSIGHQRHYSMLYAHANEIVGSGMLGEIKHIRALWHRLNVRPNPDERQRADRPFLDSWWPLIPAEDRRELEAGIRRHGYKDMEELVRWRLFMRTGGGLMAELGSHQLDACSIFLGKKRPLSVTAVGGTHFYGVGGNPPDNREVEDHVYCIYEFPGPHYDARQANSRKNDIVTVTYSSISTNGFEKYGECVMGSKGTLVVEEEQNAMLYGVSGRATSMTASAGALVDASSTSGSPTETRATSVGATALGAGPPSRGYREEMEHLAYLIRMQNEGMASDRETLKPRCDGRAAMADAIIALSANQAMKHRRRIEFQDAWFDDVRPNSSVPDEDMVEEDVR
jgi:predicted dehydrogenase